MRRKGVRIFGLYDINDNERLVGEGTIKELCIMYGLSMDRLSKCIKRKGVLKSKGIRWKVERIDDGSEANSNI